MTDSYSANHETGAQNSGAHEPGVHEPGAQKSATHEYAANPADDGLSTVPAESADNVPTGSRRSLALALIGIIALAVAAWGLAGGPTWGRVNFWPWTIVIVGVLAGIALVVSGFRRN